MDGAPRRARRSPPPALAAHHARALVSRLHRPGARRPRDLRGRRLAMCGSAGIVGAERLHADERARLTLMRAVLTHRGPDDAGTFCDERAGLAHRRLSIVDLAAGPQPLSNEDGSIWIVFN